MAMITKHEFQYLFRILTNTFNNANRAALSDPDCLTELEEAVAGLEDAFLTVEERVTAAEERLEQQKQLIVRLEARLER